MFKQYLEKSAQLFCFKDSCDKLESVERLDAQRFFQFPELPKTEDFLEGYIAHNLTSNCIYTMESSVAPIKRTYRQGCRLEMVINLLNINKRQLDYAVATVLNNRGFSADITDIGVSLSNGRFVASIGMWTIYKTNQYNYVAEDGFEELLAEESEIVRNVMSLYKGFYEAAWDNPNLINQLKDIIPTNSIRSKLQSESVLRYRNRDKSEESIINFFDIMTHIKNAETLVEGAALNETLVDSHNSDGKTN